MASVGKSGPISFIGCVARFLLGGVIVPTGIQLLLLVIGVLADLLCEGIGLAHISRGSNYLIIPIAVATDGLTQLLVARIGILRSITLALDARDLLCDGTEGVCGSLLVQR